MKWIIGIDGGGTKTVGCAAGLTGKILGRVEQGPGNYHVTGLGGFKTVIASIIHELAANCGLDTADLAVVSLGLAGADRLRDREIIRVALGELGLGCHYLVGGDAEAALVAGVGKAEGIVLISGTGSVAYGINRRREVIRAGGWGHLASDEGSGYAIGRKALQRGIKAREQRDKDTVLLPLIMTHFGLRDWDELVGLINSPATTKTAVASLAQVTAAAARSGDGVAAEILREAAGELADLVKSVLSRGFAGEAPVPVCLYGGIINNIEPVRAYVAAALKGKATLIPSRREPAEGALEMGRMWLREPME